MNFPKDLLYSKSHEWVRESNGTARAGLTDYAQHELGDIVFVTLPEAGDGVKTGERVADVESVKAVSEMFSPLSGTIREVNQAVADSPEIVNSDPYGAWFFVIDEISGLEDLLSPDDYEEYVGSL